ncbi:MAG: cytochrome P450 [bacterium]
MSLDFAQEAFPGNDLHLELRRIREQEGPVAQVRFATRPAWIVIGHRALETAFKDEDAFPAGEWYRRSIEPIQGRTFESMDGSEHHLTRRLATPAFRSSAVARMEAEGLSHLAHELIDTFADEGRGDLVSRFTARYPFLVVSRLLGIPTDREQDFVGWALGILSFDRGAARAFTDFLRPVLQERRSEPRSDVISHLLHEEIEGRRFTDEEVLSHVRLLFSAGATTTHDALASLIWLLLSKPELAEAARADPGTLSGIIDELLRWETPVAILPRLCLPGTELEGVRIPPEAPMLFAIAGANRDPEVFEEPDRFDPARDTRRKLTFGLGSHSCPGVHMARTNLRVAARALLERLPGLRLLDETAALPRGSTVRGSRELPVVW